MKNYMDLTGRVAIVTGASSGLGYEYCKALAENGAKVAAFARRKEKLEKLAAEIKEAGGECLPVPCDVMEEDQIIAGVQKVIDTYGKVDILVNNAGSMAYCPTTELTLEAWDKVVRLSITGYFLMARECAKSMIKNHYGRIINIASMYGRIASFHHPILAYNTTKGAVPNFTRGLAQEWAQYGITVNAIGPGEFPSEMMVFDDAALEELKKRCPIARPGKIEELCGQLLLFASENSAYTTGQTIYIDGGWTSV
ncbi:MULTISPECIES: SDR family NAD(P)-dependent oxidoreductase [unclassified Clostridium]|jgi:NAD(P)-dependent dehydrogenase (short-subunit alcohol dehydrogenase family)|uniref:SDR family NAD(P)-dependent oxidoreductase n=1 Tax=Clostridia TaxID=186801 RepID=UPI000E504633|nr:MULTISPECIES: SDR family NAD(P)-dependent oxidoreductase [unclassified Clostridium]RHP46723.1 SDR family NAD(P)-dependent oxidoreductase [Clostridium sp. AF32-12BH]RHS88401.1 SDR family NAD(P)-dependent oxidoreductase [Clostridium sp. AM42-4]